MEPEMKNGSAWNAVLGAGVVKSGVMLTCGSWDQWPAGNFVLATAGHFASHNHARYLFCILASS